MGSVPNIVKRCALPSLSLLLLVAAGLGCAAGRGHGGACTASLDCEERLVCFMGKCDNPGACSGAGSTCAKQEDCCGALLACQRGTCVVESACVAAGGACSGASCCGTLTCQAGTCKTPPTSCAGRACQTSASCCGGFTCSRFGKTCQAAQNLATGDACTGTGSGQCRAPGMCLNGYCTKFCSKTADCGPANYCLGIDGGQFVCVPFCQGNADCSVFGIGITCQQSTDPGGLALKGCFSS